MFQAGFLGHQGWWFATGQDLILVDPILTDAFGHAGPGWSVWPPRRLSLDLLPAPRAVVLSHESEGHFCLKSLDLLPRTVPILLPRRSSFAARVILEEMGFDVQSIEPGSSIKFGQLEFSTIHADNSSGQNLDSWDALPYVVRDSDGAGSFFAGGGLASGPEVESEVRALVGKPGIWCYANSALDFSFCTGGHERVNPLRPDTSGLAASILADYRRRAFQWERDAAVVFCGNGWSFQGGQSWMNSRVFEASSEKVCEALRVWDPDRLFLAPRPGWCVSMEDGVVAGVAHSSSFLTALDQDSWPDRQPKGEGALLQEYGPVTGRQSRGPSDLEDVRAGLKDLAEYLYGGPLFRGLFSLGEMAEGDPKQTICVVLLEEDCQYTCFEYSPQRCDFVETESDEPFSEFVLGFECWLTDLAAVFRGELTIASLLFGAMRDWNLAPEVLSFPVRDALKVYAHPLRRPEKYLSLYRSIVRSRSAAGHVRSS